MPKFRISGEFGASGAKSGTPAPAASGGGRSPGARSAPDGTQSTQRLLALLDQFSTEHPTHTVEGLSEAISVPRSTVYRLVSLLKGHELLEQAGESRYQLGPKAIMLGYVARSTVDLADIWRPGLEQLAGNSRETALVLRRIGDAAVCVDRVECDHPVRLSFDVGKAMPLHTGAGAKVLLAGSPAEVRDRYIDGAVPPAQRARLRAEPRRSRPGAGARAAPRSTQASGPWPLRSSRTETAAAWPSRWRCPSTGSRPGAAKS